MLYIIDQKTQNFWKTLSMGIIKEDQIKRNKPIDLKYRYSNFKNLSQDSSAFISPQKQPSQNNLPTTFFQESELIIDLKKQVKKIHNQKWNIDYHYFRNESRTMRIVTLDARNIQDGEILYADNENEINIQGRKSCECLIEGLIGSKLKRLGNFQTEVLFHKRKRLANILIDNLSQTKRRSTFGKHQIKTTRQRWGLKFKGINNIVQMPQLARSSINYHYFRNQSRTMRIATLDAKNMQDGEILYADNENEINIQGFRRKSCESLIEGLIGSKLKRLGSFLTEVQFHKRKRLANILIDNLSQTKRRSTFGKYQIKTTMQRWGLKFKRINNISQMPQFARSSSFEDDSPKTGPLTSKVLFEDGSTFVIQNPSKCSFEDDSTMKIQIPSKFYSQRSIMIRGDSRLLKIQTPVIKTTKNFIQQLPEEEDEFLQTQSVRLLKIAAPVSIKRLSEAQKNLYYPRPKQMQRNILSVSSFNSQHTLDYTRSNYQINDTAKISSSARNIILKSQHMLPNITIKKNLSQGHFNKQQQKFPGIYTNVRNQKSLLKRNRSYKVNQNFLSFI